MDETLRNAAENDLRRAEVAAVPAHRDDPIVVWQRCSRRRQSFHLGNGQAKEATLPSRIGFVDGPESRRRAVVDTDDLPRVAFADQEAAVLEWDQTPRRLEIGDDFPGARIAARLDGAGRWTARESGLLGLGLDGGVGLAGVVPAVRVSGLGSLAALVQRGDQK